MLKYITETPNGVINGINKVFTVSGFISHVDKVVVDGNTTTAFSFVDNTITFTSAPNTSIKISFFLREIRDMSGNGEITYGDLIDGVYTELGRKIYSRIYKREQIERELNTTIGRLFNRTNSVSKLLTYSFSGQNGLLIYNTSVNLTPEEVLGISPIGCLIGKNNIYIDYYDYDGEKFSIVGADILKPGDKVSIGTRVPYGVEKVSEVYLDGNKLTYIDSREFDLFSRQSYTIIKNYLGEEYIFLPYQQKEYTVVVKFIPTATRLLSEESVVDINYNYSNLPIFEVCYRLLSAKEDDRGKIYEKFYKELLQEYLAYKATLASKTRYRIKIADPVDRNIQYSTRRGREDLYI